MPRTLGVGFLTVLLGAASWLSARKAEARERTTIFYLEYTASEGCPGEVTFRSQVRARTSKLDFAESPAGAQRLVVRIAALESGFLGRLSFEAAPGELAAREVQAESCDEVVAALALTTALNVDPAVERETTASAPSAPWSIGAQLSLTGVPSSFPAPRVGAFVDWFAPFGSWIMGGRGTFAYSFGSEGSRERGRTALSLLSARLSLCPLGRRWVVETFVCALGEVGALQARGEDVEAPRSSGRAWVAGGSELSLRFPALSTWFLGASGELLIPLTRQRFVLEDGTEVYAVPRLTGAAGLSFGIRFL